MLRRPAVPVCAAALGPEELAAIDRQIADAEVPDCTCKPARVRSCLLFYGSCGCPDRQRPACITRAHPDGCARFEATGRCGHRPCNRCECGLVAPPCEHVLAARNGLTLGEWVEMLALRNPTEYEDPPPVLESEEVLARKVIVAIYRERAERGVALFHKDDFWRKDLDLPSVARLAQRGPNGSTTVYDEYTGELVSEELVCEGV